MDNKSLVYVYNSKKQLKEIKTFDTLEKCFNFVSEQNRKYTMNIKLHEPKESKKQSIQLDLF